MAAPATPPPHRPTGRSTGPRGWLGPLLTAGLLFAGLSLLMRAQERGLVRAIGTVDAPMDPAGPPVRIAEIASAVRALKLVTVEITSTAIAQSQDESWRGDVSALVRAPVRLFYGTDLSRLDAASITWSPGLAGLVIRVPAPRRIATEVYGEAERYDVRAGWARFRSRAGEYHLGLARSRLHEAAVAMRLDPRQAEDVRRMTREQVAGLVRTLTQGRVPVEVVFIETEEPPGSQAPAGTGPAGPVASAGPRP
ncbi:MAG TPA: DUF4230 domain-containing protein [Phycisphaerales bacterium]|nr:DUF4230 domain-containing protein [Phycisphaerales bacterium]